MGNKQSPNRVNIGILLLAVWGVVFSFAFGFVMLLTDMDAMIGTGFFQVFGLGVPFFVYLIVTKQSFRDVLPWKKLSIENAFIIVLLTLSTIPMISVLSRVLSFFFVPVILDMDIAATPLWLSLLIVGVFPSLFEEFWFRGAMYTEYRAGGVPVVKTALVTALFFGLMHMNFQQAIYAGVIGILCAFTVHYTRSFLAPVLGHFINNGLAVLLSHNEGYSAWHGELWGRPILYLLVFGAISLLALPVLIFCIMHLKKYHAATEPPEMIVDADAVAADSIDAADEAPPGDAPAPAQKKPAAFTWALWLALAIYLFMCLMMEFFLRLEWIMERM